MPELMIFAGCNGAGKTTAAKVFLPQFTHIQEFINADNIASGLSPFNPESVAIDAGRYLIDRFDLLVSKKLNFAIETTLAGKSYIKRLHTVKASGYKIILFYFYISEVSIAKERILKRVQSGGHYISDSTVERRFTKSIENFKNIYKNLADEWYLYNNDSGSPQIISFNFKSKLTVTDKENHDNIFSGS